MASFLILHGVGKQYTTFFKIGNSRGEGVPKYHPGTEIPRGWGGGS